MPTLKRRAGVLLCVCSPCREERKNAAKSDGNDPPSVGHGKPSLMASIVGDGTALHVTFDSESHSSTHNLSWRKQGIMLAPPGKGTDAPAARAEFPAHCSSAGFAQHRGHWRTEPCCRTRRSDNRYLLRRTPGESVLVVPRTEWRGLSSRVGATQSNSSQIRLRAPALVALQRYSLQGDLHRGQLACRRCT